MTGVVEEVRLFGHNEAHDDRAIIGGTAFFNGDALMIVAQQKGSPAIAGFADEVVRGAAFLAQATDRGLDSGNSVAWVLGWRSPARPRQQREAVIGLFEERHVLPGALVPLLEHDGCCSVTIAPRRAAVGRVHELGSDKLVGWPVPGVGGRVEMVEGVAQGEGAKAVVTSAAGPGLSIGLLWTRVAFDGFEGKV